MWVFWPIVKLFNHSRDLMMQTKKSLDLFSVNYTLLLHIFFLFSNLILSMPFVALSGDRIF